MSESIPAELSYTKDHEWMRVEGPVATVGITDHAQEALGDVTFVELPEAGKEFKAGDEVCAIESAKAASSIYAPSDGKVIEANDAVEEDPSIVNTDPYGKGWIYKLELSDGGRSDGLMTAEQYKEFLAQEEE